MKIQGNSNLNAHAYGQIKRQQAQGEQTTPTPFSERTGAQTSPQTTSTEKLNIGKVEGVIRNLQEGHYKGVAQLRLSIVHAERFQQVASQASVEVFEAEGESLTAAVQDKIASLFTSFDTTGELESSAEKLASLDLDGAMKAFEDAVVSGKEGAESGQPTIQAFTDLYTAAFQALVSKLDPVETSSVNGITAPELPVVADADAASAATEELVEGAAAQPSQAATSEVGQEQTGGSAELDALKDWFSGVLERTVESIQSQVDTLSTPPLTAQRSGKGAAYEKFLAVYQEIYGIKEQQPDASLAGETDAITTEA